MAPSAFSDICLKENMTLADRLYNLQLIQDFCKDNLNSCCHFSMEDMLYASSTIKVLLKPRGFISNIWFLQLFKVLSVIKTNKSGDFMSTSCWNLSCNCPFMRSGQVKKSLMIILKTFYSKICWMSQSRNLWSDLMLVLWHWSCLVGVQSLSLELILHSEIAFTVSV